MDSALHRMIELHDTTVAAIVEVGEQIVVFLRAYIHQSEGRPGWDAGSGWVQAAALTFAAAFIEGEIPDLPDYISSGNLIVDGKVHRNNIPIPFSHKGEVSLVLQLDIPTETVIRGTQATLTLLGEPVYVEEFSGIQMETK